MKYEVKSLKPYSTIERNMLQAIPINGDKTTLDEIVKFTYLLDMVPNDEIQNTKNALRRTVSARIYMLNKKLAKFGECFRICKGNRRGSYPIDIYRGESK